MSQVSPFNRSLAVRTVSVSLYASHQDLLSPLALSSFLHMVFQVPYNKSKMLFQRRNASIDWIRLAQLTFATLSLLAAGAILGTAARTFHVFQSQRASNNPWWLPLWPGHFDVTGTKVYLGTSSVVILLSIIYLSLHLVPAVSLRHEPTYDFRRELTSYRSLLVQSWASFSPLVSPSSRSYWRYQP